jgi:proline racemase
VTAAGWVTPGVAGAVHCVVDGVVHVGAVVAGGGPAIAGSTIVGNCTRWAQAVDDANRQPTTTRPRNAPTMDSVEDFKLGTEC